MISKRLLLILVFFTNCFTYCVNCCSVISPGDERVNASKSVAIVTALNPILTLNFEQTGENDTVNSRASSEEQCRTELETCKEFILNSNESYYIADACGTFNKTLSCLNRITSSKCPLTHEDEVDLNQRLAKVHTDMESICGEYFKAQAEADNSFAGCRCWTGLDEPVRKCAELNSDKLFGQKPSPTFCCDYVEYETCVQKGVGICPEDVFRKYTASYVKEYYNNGSLAGNVDECISETHLKQKC